MTGTGATVHATAAEYPQSTPICSSHNGTPLYETDIAGQQDSRCVPGTHIPYVHISCLKVDMPILTCISYILTKMAPLHLQKIEK